MKTVLTAHGYTVFEATRGEDAVWQVSAQQPDVIVLDLGLPDMDAARPHFIVTEPGVGYRLRITE